MNVGLSLRLTFEQPVRGPIALGFGSHFGLGLFEPEGA
jgi:CRISPR-associated protein Csb2